MNESNAFSPEALGASQLLLTGGRLAVNLLAMLLLVGAAYRPNRFNREAVFSFFVFNLLIFFLCSLLLNCQIRLEFAFGLFAVFSMLRYRTGNMSLRNMTYLFAAICIGLINAIEIGAQALVWLADLILVGAVALLERFFLKDAIGSMTVVCKSIGLVKGEASEELRQALSEQTGFEVTGYQILSINFSVECAKIQVFFRKKKWTPGGVDDQSDAGT